MVPHGTVRNHRSAGGTCFCCWSGSHKEVWIHLAGSYQDLGNAVEMLLNEFTLFPTEILCSRDVLCKRKTVSRDKEWPIW